MRVRNRITVAALGLAAAALFVCNAPARAAEEVKVDLTTPKKAATTFAKGIEEGDKKAVRASSTGGDADYELFDLLSSVVAANKELQAAAVAKFKEEGKKLGQPQESLTAKVDSSIEKIEGDTATLSEGADDKEPMKLKKSSEGWKVDLTQIPNRDEVAAAKPMIGTMAKVMKELAAEIKADKYKTVEEAQQAMGMKMIGALGAGAGGPPGGADAPPSEPKK